VTERVRRRQSNINARAGAEVEHSITRSMADLANQAALQLETLAAAVAQHVRAGAAPPPTMGWLLWGRSRNPARDWGGVYCFSRRRGRELSSPEPSRTGVQVDEITVQSDATKTKH
jgi:hypothetical protein